MARQSAFRATALDHAHPETETCPYCDQAIPNDRADEIRARFDADRRRQADELKTRLDAELATQRAQFEETKNAEITKLKEDGAAALEALKTEAMAQQAAAREEGKKLADTELRQQIDNMQTERAAAKEQMEEVERQKAAAVTELATLKAQQETLVAERAAEVRTAMEKSKADEINGLKAQHAAEAQKWSEQMAALQRRVEAAEGEGADVKLLEVLKAQYPKDEFIPVKKASGADLIHVVKHNRKVCGKIVYDTRNRNAWNPSFATKLRDDMVTEKADHAILTSSKFPSGAEQFCNHDGVLVANPARVLALAEILRTEILRNFRQRVSAEDRERKTEKLYAYITSDAFGKLLSSAAGNFDKLLQLEEDEKRAHDAMWRKRGTLLTASQQMHAKLRDQIDNIVTSETEQT